MGHFRHVSATDIASADVAKAELVWQTNCVLGESPHWDRDENKLLFLDIKSDVIHILPLSGQGDRFKLVTPSILTSLTQDDEGQLLGTSSDGIVKIDLFAAEGKDVVLTPLASIEKSAPNIRFNDGKAGPLGTYWAGTMDDEGSGLPVGSIFRFTSRTDTSPVKTNMVVPNGPAFCPSGKFVYFADSGRATIFRAEIISETSTTEPVPYIKFEDGLGCPDGMSCDAEGNLWVAFWDGGCIRCFSPNLDRIEQFDIPALRPTSIAITPGQLYVTSAIADMTAEQLAEYPLSGSLFAIDIAGVKPGPDFRVRRYDA